MAPTVPPGPETTAKQPKKHKSISHKLSKVLGLKARTPKSNNATPTANPMPHDEDEIERLFLQAVDMMALPKAATDRMLTLPIAQKWQIVQDWTAKQSCKNQREQTQPVFWVQKLRDACDDAALFTNEDARQLHVLMRGSDREWLTAFHKEDGVLALAEWMALVAADNHTTLLLDAIRCVKCMMNNPHGMQLFLQELEAIDILALCLDFSADRKAETLVVLEMLSLMCWFSETGHAAVLQAMEKFRRVHQEAARYASVVEGLKTSESIELQAACLTFINTLVNTCAVLEDRVAVRNDFLALDLLVICHGIQNQVDALPRSSSSYGAWGCGETEEAAAKALLKQIDVFEGLMHSDMEETIGGDKIDLSNVDAVAAKLKAQAARHGWTQRLLNVLLALLVIPGEVSVSSKMWDLIEEALGQVTAIHTFKELSGRRMDFSAVRTAQQLENDLERERARAASLQAQVEQFQAKLAVLQSQPMTVEQQNALEKLQGAQDVQKQLDAALKTNQELKNQVAKLKVDLETAKTMPRPSADEANGAGADPRLEKYAKLLQMGMPQEQVGLKMRSEGLDMTMLDSKASTSVQSPPTATTPNAVDPSLEKYAKLLKMGMPLVQVEMKAKAEGVDQAKLADLSRLASQGTHAAPTAPPPPTTPIGVNPAYEKFFKLIKMGMPKEQVKLKAQAEGLDPSVLDQAPSASASGTSSGAPSIPAMNPAALKLPTKPKGATSSNPASATTSKLPPKKTAVPAAKLRCLYWTPLPDASVEGSIWASIDESSLGLDLTILEKEFRQDAAKKPADVAIALPKPKVVHLVDSKRQQNCSIALSRFRMTAMEIKLSIEALDDKVLTLERVQMLETMVPSTDELELVKSYDGDVALLGETEKFFLAVANIPRLAQRLKAFQAMLTHASRMDDVKAKLHVMERALTELQKSQQLVIVLQVVLAVGNYMNSGTCRGGLYGFKLDILPKLTQVKATSSAKSLLHVIADLVAAKTPQSATSFADQLASMDDAAFISLTQLHTDVQAIESGLGVVATELPLQREVFKAKMQPFVTAAQADCASLKQLLVRVQCQFQSVARSFGVDKAPGDGVDLAQWFFGLWAEFAKAFKQAVAENAVMRRKEAQSAIATTSAKSVEPEDGDLFNQFSESLEGDARDIVAKFRKRHQGGGNNGSVALQNELALQLARRRTSKCNKTNA
ncbi:hypothetical protein LEN26_014686 [Aphanomyces euteiches]|nr:hypothetical protein LEN26_014686 [Aphanomyces euteiches]